ncbi:SEL1 domain containing protein RGD735029, isoform CRA_a [Rattus norvegicus]|uniref:SEL1 domain containing protein RGD735029, isoform CRA_a n=1 Tax=Rattus norvegicus TaxID=10116 RepID=A6J3F4_RAT|nr:SEL1 domain containing protein RGD735029, isoform CRA_a [Rattus norvegicus]
MWRLTGILGRALPRLLGPGFRGITPKPTSSDGPQTTSTTLPLPRVNFDRSGSHGSKRNRDPKCCGWKEAFHWMSAHVSPNTLRDAVSWVRLPHPVLGMLLHGGTSKSRNTYVFIW